MTKIIFSGFGGQGILTLGQIVATIAMKKGSQVSWMPSYGAEMRGGTANCAVIISDTIIGSPIVDSEIDILCAMNDASVMKFLGKVREDGNAFINSSIVVQTPQRAGVNIREIDATNIATKIGNAKVANMVMLAGFLKDTDLFTMEDVAGALNDIFGEKYPHLIPLNIEAVKAGG